MACLLRFFLVSSMLIIGLFCTLAKPLLAENNQLQYSVVLQSGAGLYEDRYKLFVEDNNKTYLIEPNQEDWYLDKFYKEVIETIDLDSDGNEEAVLRTQGTGNCCGPTFFIVSKIDQGFFVVVTHEDLSGWPDLSIKYTDNDPEIWVHNIPEGVEITSQESTLTIFKFINGQLIRKAKHFNTAFLISDLEVTSAQVSSGEDKVLEVDLDLDGKKDQMICSYWDRWGAVNCDIKSSKYGDLFLSGGCNRIGVLESTTDGVRDLVCNRDHIFRFNLKEVMYDYGD